jgi:hypothetical protein
MKIYIGNQEIDESVFKKIKNVELISYIADDSECTEIVIDNALRTVSMNDLNNRAALIRSKMRLGSKLVVNDIDFDLLSFHQYKNTDIVQANQFLFPCSSVLNMDLVISLFQSVGLEVVSKTFNGLNFVLEFRRSS